MLFCLTKMDFFVRMQNMAKKHILIVEDDSRLAGLTSDYLLGNQFEVTVVERGDIAVETIQNCNPDLVILDLMLPGKDGFTICKEIRSFYRNPILILTAREEDMDQVIGLEIGADDYVKKPVSPRVLLARVQNLLRRFCTERTILGSHNNNEVESIVFGGLEISISKHEVTLNKKLLELGTTEFDLLLLLAKNAGKVLERNFICQNLKGYRYDGLDRTVDMSISRLRKKLGDNKENPTRIKTVWGKGYLLVEDAW